MLARGEGGRKAGDAKMMVTIKQGRDENGRDFGYAHSSYGKEGGFYFTWLDTLDATIDSVEEDKVAGGGGHDLMAVKHDLRNFLAGYFDSQDGDDV